MIQYHHSVNGPGGPKKEAPSSAAVQPAPGSEYELVAAVSGIRAQVYGEDFQDFMHHGATQRSSVHAYMDLFCYQAPASRCTVHFPGKMKPLLWQLISLRGNCCGFIWITAMSSIIKVHFLQLRFSSWFAGIHYGCKTFLRDSAGEQRDAPDMKA